MPRERNRAGSRASQIAGGNEPQSLKDEHLHLLRRSVSPETAALPEKPWAEEYCGKPQSRRAESGGRESDGRSRMCKSNFGSASGFRVSKRIHVPASCLGQALHTLLFASREAVAADRRAIAVIQRPVESVAREPLCRRPDTHAGCSR